MPNNSEAGSFYSLQELAWVLKATPVEITNFIEVKSFPKSVIDGKHYIEYARLSAFFDEFFSYRNTPPRYYEIPEYLKKSTNPWAVTLVKMYQEKVARPACVSPDQGKFLKNLICEIKPNNVLEIGCYIGVSTIWLASGLEEMGSSQTIIHSVDLFNDIMPAPPVRYGYLANPFEFAQKSAIAAQLSHRIKFYKMDSRTMGGKQFKQLINKPLDFLYIDGDHSIYGCLSDFVLFYNHIPLGGYIILHDIYPEVCGYRGPRYVIDKYIKNSPYFYLTEVETAPNNFGIAIIRKMQDSRKLYFEAHSELKLRDIMVRVKEAVWPRIKDKPLGNFIKKALR